MKKTRLLEIIAELIDYIEENAIKINGQDETYVLNKILTYNIGMNDEELKEFGRDVEGEE